MTSMPIVSWMHPTTTLPTAHRAIIPLWQPAGFSCNANGLYHREQNRQSPREAGSHAAEQQASPLSQLPRIPWPHISFALLPP